MAWQQEPTTDSTPTASSSTDSTPTASSSTDSTPTAGHSQAPDGQCRTPPPLRIAGLAALFAAAALTAGACIVVVDDSTDSDPAADGATSAEGDTAGKATPGAPAASPGSADETADGTTPTTVPAQGSEGEGTPGSGTPETDRPASTTTMPGHPFGEGPAAGDVLAVTGVAYNDVLNVREIPLGDITDTLEPFIRGPEDWGPTLVVATGRSRSLPGSLWHEVGLNGLTGWVSAAYLSQLGAEEELTDHILAALGRLPTEQTLSDLADAVVDALGHPVPPTRVVISDMTLPLEGVSDLIVDVLNIKDDSILGIRLVMWASADFDWMTDDPPDGPYTLQGVSRILLCGSSRGVTQEGLCR